MRFRSWSPFVSCGKERVLNLNGQLGLRGGAGARCESRSGQQADDGPIRALSRRSRRATFVQLLFPLVAGRATLVRGKAGLEVRLSGPFQRDFVTLGRSGEIAPFRDRPSRM